MGKKNINFYRNSRKMYGEKTRMTKRTLNSERGDEDAQSMFCFTENFEKSGL